VQTFEGCLSTPTILAKLKRYDEISILFKNIDGNQQSLNFSDISAVAIQHSFDYLNGINPLDNMTGIQKMMVKKKIKKFINKNLKKYKNQRNP
jgi:peptide deformylase